MALYNTHSTGAKADLPMMFQCNMCSLGFQWTMLWNKLTKESSSIKVNAALQAHGFMWKNQSTKSLLEEV